jgi:hypothetical protein
MPPQPVGHRRSPSPMAAIHHDQTCRRSRLGGGAEDRTPIERGRFALTSGPRRPTDVCRRLAQPGPMWFGHTQPDAVRATINVTYVLK